MYYNLLSIILMASLAGWCCAYTVKPIEFELLDDKFRLSLPNDPDITWVSFHVNINKEFEGFEMGQLTGITTTPRNDKWSYEFEKQLKGNDIIYIWLALQYNRLIFREKKDPISVEAIKSGNSTYQIRGTAGQKITETPLNSSTVSRHARAIDVPKAIGAAKATQPFDAAEEINSTKAIDVTNEKTICRPTISEVPRSFGGPYCRDDLIFEDNFDTINTQYWTNEIRISSLTEDAEFVLYNGSLHVQNGELIIEAGLNNKHLIKDNITLGIR